MTPAGWTARGARFDLLGDTLEGMMTKTYPRFSTALKLQLVEAYLAGGGSIQGLANPAGVGIAEIASCIHFRPFVRTVDRRDSERTIVEALVSVGECERKHRALVQHCCEADWRGR